MNYLLPSDEALIASETSFWIYVKSDFCNARFKVLKARGRGKEKCEIKNKKNSSWCHGWVGVRIWFFIAEVPGSNHDNIKAKKNVLQIRVNVIYFYSGFIQFALKLFV